MARFRARAKAFILTFPQTSEDVQRQFSSNGGTFLESVQRDFEDPVCIRIGRESHSDGGIHFHVFLSFESPVTVNRPDAFDYFGAHGNIKSVRSTPRKVYDYVTKDGDVVFEHGEAPPERGNASGDVAGRWHSIVASSDKESFLAAVRTEAPRDWVLSLDRILAYAEYAFPTIVPDYVSPSVVVRGEQLDQWGGSELDQWKRQANIGQSSSERYVSCPSRGWSPRLAPLAATFGGGPPHPLSRAPFLIQIRSLVALI